MPSSEKVPAIIGDWLLSHIRFSIFVESVANLDESLFETFFGFPHETATTKRNEFNEYSVQKGAVTYKCSIYLVANKIDLIAVAGFAEDEAPDSFPSLPNMAEFESSFNSGAKKCLSALTNIRRLAVSEQFISLVGSKQEAYERLSALTHIDLDPIKASDFLYRINIPTASHSSDVPITFNRLSTWGAIKTQTILLQPDAIAEELAVSAEAVSVSTDVNTAPKFNLSTLSKDALFPIIDDLFESSREIPIKGLI